MRWWFCPTSRLLDVIIVLVTHQENDIRSSFILYRCHADALIPSICRCLACGKIWFCSDSCRQESSCYHNFECGLEAVLNSVGIAHLGARIVLSHGLDSVLAFLKDTDKVKKVPGIDGPYDTKSYQVMFHLVSHTERMAPEELYQYALVRNSNLLLYHLYCIFMVSLFF